MRARTHTGVPGRDYVAVARAAVKQADQHTLSAVVRITSRRARGAIEAHSLLPRSPEGRVLRTLLEPARALVDDTNAQAVEVARLWWRAPL